MSARGEKTPHTLGRVLPTTARKPRSCRPPPVQAPTANFSLIFGRTDLIIAASRAKNCGEVDGEVRLPVDAPKLAQKDEKRCPTRKKIIDDFFCFAEN